MKQYSTVMLNYTCVRRRMTRIQFWNILYKGISCFHIEHPLIANRLYCTISQRVYHKGRMSPFLVARVQVEKQVYNTIARIGHEGGPTALSERSVFLRIASSRCRTALNHESYELTYQLLFIPSTLSPPMLENAILVT